MQNLRLDVVLLRKEDRVEVFKGELPWNDEPKGQAQASVDLASVGIENAFIGISCSKGRLNSLGGFAVLSFRSVDQLSFSFCCLPNASQSLRIRIGSDIIEVMMTNRGET